MLFAATSRASARNARLRGSAPLGAYLSRDVTEAAPDHSRLSRIRQRLPLEVHTQACQWVLQVAQAKGVLRGQVLAIEATIGGQPGNEVDGAPGEREKWLPYLRRLAAAERLESPSDEDLRRFGERRTGKKVSNAEGLADGSGQPHHEHEGWPDALRLQGRARDRSGQCSGGERGDVPRATRRTADRS